MIDRIKSIRGVAVPTIGIGTWNLRGARGQSAVEMALELGYRHIDTAEMYRNESEIGHAIAVSGVPREELFLVSKVWRTNLRRDEVLGACDDSLKRLGVEALDLYLIHWPSRAVPIEETMEAMDELVSSGRTRTIGVSNFTIDQMQAAHRASEAGVFCNQVEYHPNQGRSDLQKVCAENDILLTAYSPVAKGRLARDRALQEIGDRHGKTAAQVALRWLIEQENVVAIPKSQSEAHLRENLAVFDFELTDEERATISRAV